MSPNGPGEIMLRGRHIFMGYLNDEEKTRAAIDEEGWLHSGDVGRVDSNNLLYITGRIKVRNETVFNLILIIYLILVVYCIFHLVFSFH